jgi:hypothetical protein
MSTEIVSKSPSGCTAHTKKQSIGKERGKRVKKHSPSHIHTVLSRLQLANNVPDAEYATLLHSVSCPSSVLTHSHSHSDPKSPPLPSSSAPVLSRACCSPCACAQPSPCTCACVCGFSPVPSRSHIPIFESNEAVASVCPDGAHATALTVFAWPVGMFDSRENLYVVLVDGGEAE